jgi:hypothetical protein
MLWEQIQRLKGKTLYTLARNKPFDIVDVQVDRIVFTPQQGNGTQRWASREQIETIATIAATAPHTLTPALVQEQYPDDRNTSYIAAIVKAVHT